MKHFRGYGLLGMWVLLAVLAVLRVDAAYAKSNDSQHAGWYISVGVGANQSATLEQSGHNRDTTCYPTRDCGHLPGGMPGGYRWFYDLRPETGAAFELAVGRTFTPIRVELSFGRQSLDLEQEFTGLTYLDGSVPVPATDSGYASRTTAGVDGLTLHTLALNAYYDLPLPRSRVTPYVGAGLGVSFTELSGLHFSEHYSCTDASRCENPGRYDGRQDVDMSDTVASLHFHAGADYRLGERLAVGLKLSYSLTEDMREHHAYTYHALPGMSNEARVAGIGYGSLMINFKYLFGIAPGQVP